MDNHRSFKSTVALIFVLALQQAPAQAQAFPAPGGIDVPTGYALGIKGISPLMGATPFSQQLARFEEFGSLLLPTTETPNSGFTVPSPKKETGSLCDGYPSQDGQFEGTNTTSMFLSQPIFPLPTREANTIFPNPWESIIRDCLGGNLAGSFIEGRPPGELYAHQRWDEFKPKVYVQTASLGAQVNSGFRDGLQSHRYLYGEFGPGGLYHTSYSYKGPVNPTSSLNRFATSGTGEVDIALEGTTKGMPAAFHPMLPEQGDENLWSYDGTFPPKLMSERYGEPMLFRQYNGLPIDPTVNGGFGLHTLTTHEHNGHHPAESDGGPAAYFFPGQYYDYRWPNVLAGYDSLNTKATDPRAGMPCSPGEVVSVSRPAAAEGAAFSSVTVTCPASGSVNIPGDYRETTSTHWFHDHMLDHTAQNVFKGLAAMNSIYSAIDRGNENFNCNYSNPRNVNLCLPSGKALSWGNKDYDVNLMISDKAWGSSGQMWFNVFNTDGFLGDRLTVNLLYKPWFNVRARQYRFRILNAGVSRYLKLALVNEGGARIPFHLIANDGNLMEHALRFPNAKSSDLPVQGIAERFDIIVDFAKVPPGSRLYLVNLLAHVDGKKPDKVVSLASIFNNTYRPDDINPMTLQRLGDPAVGKLLEFRVVPYAGIDTSMRPEQYVEGQKILLQKPNISVADIAGAKHRNFEFTSSGTDANPWAIRIDGGKSMGANMERVAAGPDVGSMEIWHLKSGGGWNHPIHIHFEEGQVLSTDGKSPPDWYRLARKDVYRVGGGPEGYSTMDIAMRFREFPGTFVEHCHNTMHEDRAMLLRWDIERPGEVVPIPIPIPTWSGVVYQPSFGLSTRKTGSPLAAGPFFAANPTLLTARDTDQDGIRDSLDNCSLEANADQRDTDGDRFGNACDPDLNNDGRVDFGDLNIFRLAWLSTINSAKYAADSDLNGDGSVDGQDKSLFEKRWQLPPGPGVGF